MNDWQDYHQAESLYKKIMNANVVIIDNKIYKDRTSLFKDERQFKSAINFRITMCDIDPSSDDDLLILTSSKIPLLRDFTPCKDF